MNFDLLSDEDIARLLALPKRVSNPSVRWQDKPGHKQRNFKVEGGDYSFELYLRRSTHNLEDFSCGLKVIKPDGQPLTLLRYNGGGHIHGEIVFSCHIHRATQRAIEAGKKAESHAEPTQNYRTLDGALACLLEDAAVSGLLHVVHDAPDLFD
ncbi:hypothetical protein [Nitrosomonas sp.]|uniref:hypothetical protein n=1 Tax=Nitrosomonas sp. TaxID=42353 RepID=UPI0027187473|nr:hypothetical protein [Nitrosomonas sp.]MDO8895382.1 hypothetical protein [Nitrosomonas sp.]